MLITDLADILRAAGVNVSEVPGWKTASHRPMLAVRGVICHHTAGPPHAHGTPSLNVVIRGRPDVSGPLCNIYLATDGTAYTVAAGRANHAGKGEFHGITDGGSNLVGIEAENAGDGHDPWPAIQMDAYARICAALAKHYSFPVDMVIGHKEWALPRGRKIDPSFDMGEFRASVAAHMGGQPVAAPSAKPLHPVLRLGSKGGDVVTVQRALAVHGRSINLAVDGSFGPATEAAVKAFQREKGLTPDGIVGSASWAALGI